MRGFKQAAWTEFKLNLRDPLMVFWSIVFPTLWLLLMVVVLPGPIPGFGYEELNEASLFFPAGVSLVILCASFIGVPMTLTNYREIKVLRRFQVTPVKVSTLVAGFSASQFGFVLVGVGLLYLVARLFFNVRILGSGLLFFGVLVLGMVTFLAIGSAIGSVAGSYRSANIIIWTLFMPMLFLSELFMPISLLPAWLQPAARALPLTALNTLLRDILYGVPVENLWRLGVLAGWLLFSLFLTVRFFKWEG
jgi:ABC-2 type transport system permease protein